MSKEERRPACFLDRDGTIIIDRHYLRDPDGVELLDGAAEGLQAFSRAGYWLIVVTNQSGVGRGYYSEEDIKAVNSRMQELLLREGVELDQIFHCPHAPDEKCECRKPGPGLIAKAQNEFNIDMANSLLIGDSLVDLGLAKRYGLAFHKVGSKDFDLEGYDNAKVSNNLLDVCNDVLK